MRYDHRVISGGFYAQLFLLGPRERRSETSVVRDFLFC